MLNKLIQFLIFITLINNVFGLVITPDNLTVSFDNTLKEYTSSGSYIGSSRIPVGTEYLSRSRDITYTESGKIAVYNGTFDPMLSIYNPADNSWENLFFNGWSTVNDVTYGGIDSYKNYVFVTDMKTYGDLPSGIIRFDLNSNSAVRFLSSYEYINLTIGYDGYLYGLRDDYGRVDIIDLSDMSIVGSRQLNFGASIKSIAVDADSNIYAAGLSGDVYKYDHDARQLTYKNIGSYNSLDINMDSDGTIAIGGDDGVFITDRNFNSFQQFAVGNPYYQHAFVEFNSTYTPIPEPSTLFLFLIGFLGIFRKKFIN